MFKMGKCDTLRTENPNSATKAKVIDDATSKVYLWSRDLAADF
jgi:hypothetical protein